MPPVASHASVVHAQHHGHALRNRAAAPEAKQSASPFSLLLDEAGEAPPATVKDRCEHAPAGSPARKSSGKQTSEPCTPCAESADPDQQADGAAPATTPDPEEAARSDDAPALNAEIAVAATDELPSEAANEVPAFVALAKDIDKPDPDADIDPATDSDPDARKKKTEAAAPGLAIAESHAMPHVSEQPPASASAPIPAAPAVPPVVDSTPPPSPGDAAVENAPDIPPPAASNAQPAAPNAQPAALDEPGQADQPPTPAAVDAPVPPQDDDDSPEPHRRAEHAETNASPGSINSKKPDAAPPHRTQDTPATAQTPANEEHNEASSPPEPAPQDKPHPVQAQSETHARSPVHKPDETVNLGSQVSEAAHSAKPPAEAVHAVIQQQHATDRFGQLIPAAATPSPSSAAAEAAAAAVPIAGLAVEIAARAQAGRNRFEIRLDPPELGRIDVRLDVDRAGQVTSRLVVERVETLEALRRDAGELERALQQAGLKTSDNGLQFALRDQGFGGHDGANAMPGAARLVVPDADLPPIEAVPNGYGRMLRADGSIDIRV